MDMWYNVCAVITLLLTIQCVVEGRGAAYSSMHPKRSQESGEDSVLDIYKTAKQLEDLHETLQDVIKVLDVIGKKEAEILGEGKEESVPQTEDDKDTGVHLSMIEPEAKSNEKIDDDTSILGLQLARILSQKGNKDKIISKPPEPIPEKKSMIVDPQPRKSDPGDDDDRMFKRILAKYMKHELERDGLQVM